MGTHRIHATTQADVTGKGKVDLLICQPYPENNKYQDVKWLKEISTNLKAVYEETGHPFVKFSEQVNAPVKVEFDREKGVSGIENWLSLKPIRGLDLSFARS